jgi:hypothetical protein
MEPFGLRMLMGSLVGRWLMTGELVLKKLLVLPVSAMIEESGAGGPTGKLDNAVSILLGVSVVSGFGEVGFPPSQLGAGALRDEDIRQPLEIVLLPPCILSVVALVLCPSFGCSQVALVCFSFLPSPWDQQ